MKKFIVYDDSKDNLTVVLIVLEVEPKQIKTPNLVCHNFETNRQKSLGMCLIAGIFENEDDASSLISEHKELTEKESKIKEKNLHKIDKLKEKIEKLTVKRDKKDEQQMRIEFWEEKKCETLDRLSESDNPDFEEIDKLETEIEQLSEESSQLDDESYDIDQEIDKLEDEVINLENFRGESNVFLYQKNKESKEIIESWGLEVDEVKPRKKTKGEEITSKPVSESSPFKDSTPLLIIGIIVLVIILIYVVF